MAREAKFVLNPLMLRLWFLLVLWPSLARADRFDIIEYAKPAGWLSENNQGTLSLVKQVGNAFTIITVPPSRPSDGTVQRDFDKLWSTAVVPVFGIKTTPQTTSRKADGWDVLAGGAAGTVQGAAATVLLVEMTGNGKTIGLIVATTLPDLSEVDRLLGSIKLVEPAKPAPAPAPPPPATAGGRSTSFSDGAIARVEADWVSVTKGALQIRLHYPTALDDNSRGDTPRYFWDKLVRAPGAIVSSDRSTGFPIYMAHGPVGSRYVFMLVIVENGTAWPIEVSAPTRAEIPSLDTVAAFRNANRFSIGPDVVGAWSSASSGSVNLYYVNTGGYAGMNTATLSTAFTFDANGTYHSEEMGGTNGHVMTEKHKGTYKTSTWELTVVNEKGSKTYDAHYEAVRGGVLLHLQDRQYAGMSYTLGRK